MMTGSVQAERELTVETPDDDLLPVGLVVRKLAGESTVACGP